MCNFQKNKCVKNPDDVAAALIEMFDTANDMKFSLRYKALFDLALYLYRKIKKQKRKIKKQRDSIAVLKDQLKNEKSYRNYWFNQFEEIKEKYNTVLKEKFDDAAEIQPIE